jgi:hypothetical protein
MWYRHCSWDKNKLSYNFFDVNSIYDKDTIMIVISLPNENIEIRVDVISSINPDVLREMLLKAVVPISKKLNLEDLGLTNPLYGKF